MTIHQMSQGHSLLLTVPLLFWSPTLSNLCTREKKVVDHRGASRHQKWKWLYYYICSHSVGQKWHFQILMFWEMQFSQCILSSFYTSQLQFYTSVCGYLRKQLTFSYAVERYIRISQRPCAILCTGLNSLQELNEYLMNEWMDDLMDYVLYYEMFSRKVYVNLYCNFQ